GKHLAVHASELVVKPDFQILRRYRRPLLLRLEHTHRPALEDYVHRATRLGSSRSLNLRIGISRLEIRSGSFTSPAETDRCSCDCAAVDIQVIGRKAHPHTSLNGGGGCQNEAGCESSCLPDKLSFPRMQAVSVEAQDRPHPIKRQINAGPHPQDLPRPPP